MMRVYDMVTCSLHAPAEDAEQAAPGTACAESPHSVELGLQLHQATPKPRPALHPTLHQADIAAFLATIDPC